MPALVAANISQEVLKNLKSIWACRGTSLVAVKSMCVLMATIHFLLKFMQTLLAPCISQYYREFCVISTSKIFKCQ